MPIFSRVNQYRGVNAHFNSLAQHEDDGWSSFHTRCIVAIGEEVAAHLPPGYRISWDASLQIREYHPDTGELLRRPRRPEPDITIWDLNPSGAKSGSIAESGMVATPTLVQVAEDTLSKNEASYYRAVVIYQEKDGKLPVARIELLSPSNKPGGSSYESYIEKQDMALRAGKISLTVIDFLHESASPIPNVPSYPDGEPGAYPYNITIIDPRPTLREGQSKTYGFGVDEMIPTLNIPLAGNDVVQVNFGLVYKTTYESASGTFSDLVDYTQLPPAFENYTPIDRQRIQARMNAVQQAVAQGIDIEKNAPLPLPE